MNDKLFHSSFVLSSIIHQWWVYWLVKRLYFDEGDGIMLYGSLPISAITDF